MRQFARLVAMGIGAVAAGATLPAFADDVSNPDGLLTASTAADLDAAAEDGNLVFGRGMLKWTGGDAAAGVVRARFRSSGVILIFR